MPKPIELARRASAWFEILAGTALTAAAFAWIILPMNFAAGGVTGLARLLQALIPLPLSWLVLALNGALLLLGLAALGWEFVANTVAVSLLFPLMLDLLGRRPLLGELAADPLVAALTAGALLGIGTGLVIRGDGSCGGFDILALALNRQFRLPVDGVMNVCGCGVIALQAVGQPLLNTAYGVIVILVCSFLTERVTALGRGEHQLLIFSAHAEELRPVLLEKLDVGLTFLRAETGYRREDMKVILCVAPYRKLGALRRAVLAVDPQAFVVVDQVYHVMGQGYTLERVYRKAGTKKQ